MPDERAAMFSHIRVGANDAERMMTFFDAVLGVIGLVHDPTRTEDSPAGISRHYPGKQWPQFAVQHSFDDRPATAGNGLQIGFAMPSTAAVDRV